MCCSPSSPKPRPPPRPPRPPRRPPPKPPPPPPSSPTRKAASTVTFCTACTGCHAVLPEQNSLNIQYLHSTSCHALLLQHTSLDFTFCRSTLFRNALTTSCWQHALIIILRIKGPTSMVNHVLQLHSLSQLFSNIPASAVTVTNCHAEFKRQIHAAQH